MSAPYNSKWDLKPLADGTFEKDVIVIALLIDIRTELKKLNVSNDVSQVELGRMRNLTNRILKNFLRLIKIQKETSNGT